MANIATLRERARARIRSVITQLDALPQKEKSSPIDRLRQADDELKGIDFKRYHAEKAAGEPTYENFDRPVAWAYEILDRRNAISSVEWNFKFLIKMSGKDLEVLRVVTTARPQIDRAAFEVDLMRRPILRTLRSGWVPILVLALALAWALIYFHLHGRGADSAALTTVTQTPHKAVAEISAGRSPVATLTQGLVELRKLISAVPPVLTAVAAVITAWQKLTNPRR